MEDGNKLCSSFICSPNLIITVICISNTTQFILLQETIIIRIRALTVGFNLGVFLCKAPSINCNLCVKIH